MIGEERERVAGPEIICGGCIIVRSRPSDRSFGVSVPCILWKLWFLTALRALGSDGREWISFRKVSRANPWAGPESNRLSLFDLNYDSF